MDQFASKQRELLELEREAELEESAALLQGLPLKGLCQRGVALQKLWICSQRTGLYGRTVVNLLQRNNTEFAAHKITSGDIVGLIKQGDDTDKAEVSGVVLEVRSNSISVAFQEESEVFSISEDSQLAVVKLANDVTYRRLNNCLQGLSKLSNNHLAGILLGESEPSTPHQTFDPAILDPATQDLRFNNQNLDRSQKEAVKFALRQRELAIIHGPPGTGKTTTVVELIVHSVRCGNKVLVSAPSNIAVDNLLQRLVVEKVRCVRLGHPARIMGDLHRYSLDALVNTSDQSQIVRDIYKEIDEILVNVKKKKEGRGFREIKALRKELKEREKKVLKEILSGAEVILGTLSSSGADSPLKHLPEDHFSMTVIDECSQSLEMACWMVVPWSKKLVLAGDHLQLPPTILSKKASKDLELTLMERLITHYGDGVVRMLTTQYRMNADIMRWSSDALYGGKVQAGDCVAEHRLCDLPGVRNNELTSTVLLLIDTTGADMLEFSTMDGISKGNEGEASLVCMKVKELIDSGLKQEQIAVITPYNLQVETIRMNLHKYSKVEVRSVDGFQGREKEVVVLSLVRSNPSKEVGFLAEKRRLNVAVTRARRQVILICDTETVTRDKFLEELVNYMSEHGRVETAQLYTDLPQVERPEDTTLVASANHCTKPDTKPGKPKQSKQKNKSKNKVTNITPSVSSNIVNAPEKGTTKKINKCADFEDPSEKEKVEDDMRAKFREIIENFTKSQELVMNMSSDLNPNERRLLHEVAENFDLMHESVGQGKDRHIVLKKIQGAQNKKGQENITSIEERMDLKQNDACETKKKNITDGESLEIVTCSSCQKEIPRLNIELHKIRCAKPIVAPTPTINSVKSKKTKKKAKQAVGDDDFDAICEQFEKLDKVCNFAGCKTKVSVIGANCIFCRVRFCLSHSMAELHGCGDAAKQAARQQLHRDGKVFPGSGTQNKTLDPAKRAQIQRKLDKKLEGFSDSRKSKAPSKSKK